MHGKIASRAAALPLLLTLALLACDNGDESGSETARVAREAPAGTGEEGEAPAPAGPRSTSDGCAILTEAEVEEALGFDVVMNDNATGNCLVTPADGSPSAPAVDFRLEPRTAAFDYFAAQPDATPIAGLGERAIWATLNEMTGNVVVVLDGGTVNVAIARADGLDDRSRRQAEALARTIVAKRQATGP